MVVSTAKCGDPDYMPKSEGAFKRGASNIQNWIVEGGEFPPEGDGRYHLFINYACGWSHRCMIVRALKGLEACVPMSHTGIVLTTSSSSGEYRGWPLPHDGTGNGFRDTRDVYNSKNPGYGAGTPTRQLSVPILFCTKTKKVVSNDSAQICVMLDAAFEGVVASPRVPLYPEALRDDIEAVNAVVYPGLNDGVYRTKFARTDAAYEESADQGGKRVIFSHLSRGS